MKFVAWSFKLSSVAADGGIGDWRGGSRAIAPASRLHTSFTVTTSPAGGGSASVGTANLFFTRKGRAWLARGQFGGALYRR
jgi:hypothetical protein